MAPPMKTVVNCTTGARSEVPMSDAEQSDLAALVVVVAEQERVELALAAEDATSGAFIKARIPGVLAKARAIMADPVNAPDFTAVERKVITAAVVLDLARRHR